MIQKENNKKVLKFSKKTIAVLNHNQTNLIIGGLKPTNTCEPPPPPTTTTNYSDSCFGCPSAQTSCRY